MTSHRLRIRAGVLGLLILIAGAETPAVAAAITGLSAPETTRSGYLEVLGTGFGEEGRLLIDGADAIVTEWTDVRIIGYIPESARLGSAPVRVIPSLGASDETSVTVTQRIPDGRRRWSFRLSAPYSKVKPALSSNGTLHIVDIHKNLYAVTPEGALLWVVGDAGDKGVGVGLDGSVYTTSFSVVNAYTAGGLPRWTHRIEPFGFVSVALEVGPDGNVYVLASQGPGVFALSPEGALLWTDPESYDRPTIVYPEMIFGPGDGETQLYYYANGHVPAIGIESGQRTCEMWHAYRSPVAVGPDGSIHMVNHAWTPNCELIWEFDLGANRPNNNREGPGPSVGPDGVHYMIVNGIQFYAIRSDGSQKWHLTLDESLKAPDVDPTNTQILFGGSTSGLQQGYVVSRSTKNGRESWRHTFDPVGGFNHFVDTRPRFTPDATIAYISTVHGTSNVYENAAYFHALDITPRGDCAVPAEVQALRFPSTPTRLTWDPAEPGADYDVVRGEMAGLRTGTEPACEESAVSRTWLDDPDAPAGGRAYYYLVRGRNGCGKGTWGRHPDGSPRAYTACH